MIMPFGKYVGEEVSELPVKYLRWLYKNVNLFGDLKVAVYTELGLTLPELDLRDIQKRPAYQSDEISPETAEKFAGWHRGAT